MGGNRALTLQATASNILNIVNYAVDRHDRELADVRPGPVGPADAIGAAQFPVPILMKRLLLSSRSPAALFTRCAGSAQAQQPQAPRPVFRANTQLVSVDVIVRDDSGAVVRGLTAADFEVLEDGKPQEIRSFTFEEISDHAEGDRVGRTARRRAGADGQRQQAQDAGAGCEPPPAPRPLAEGAPAKPMTSEELAGRRLIVLLFDIASMQPEDVQRAVDSAQQVRRHER